MPITQKDRIIKGIINSNNEIDDILIVNANSIKSIKVKLANTKHLV